MNKIITNNNDYNVDYNLILSLASNISGVTKDEIISHGRAVDKCLARTMVSTYLNTRNGWTLSKIGKHLGGRDHSTIIHQVNNHEIYYKHYPPYKSWWTKLITTLDIRKNTNVNTKGNMKINIEVNLENINSQLAWHKKQIIILTSLRSNLNKELKKQLKNKKLETANLY